MEQFRTIDSIMDEGVEIEERQVAPKYRTPHPYNVLTPTQRLYLPFKRLLSIVLSLFGLVLTFPLFIVVAVAIKLDSKGPVFYNRVRVGKNGKHFVMYKFRSMYDNAENQIEDLYEKNVMEGVLFKIKDDPRITRVGRWIRKTSVDELPQLLNILKGQMTIVGPRPVLPDEYDLCQPEQRTYFSSLTPGLTCYWQINGRNNITSFEERVMLDMKYIYDMGPITDLSILVKTIPVVITGDGAY